MNPYFFGDSGRPLFGIYHPPNSHSVRDVGVLLCYPMPQEYMRTHWAFRKLSNLLSNEGFHVFRFDYFGTGDSAGDSNECDVSQWKADIRAAVDELKDMSRVKKVSIVGLRLGAALAAEASTEGLNVQNLVLWDPVVSGKSHIYELKAMHDHLFPDFQEEGMKENFDELLGFPFPSEMRAAIEHIDLLELSQCVTERALLIVSEERTEYLQLRDQLIATGVQLDYRVIPDAGDWGKTEMFDQALLVNDILQGITAGLARSPT